MSGNEVVVIAMTNLLFVNLVHIAIRHLVDRGK